MAISSDQQHSQEPLELPPRYNLPAPSKEILDYADLAIVDLSEARTTEGRARLAVQIRKAMTTQGFFYAINHGYTQEQTNHIFSLANITFDGVTPEEKAQYEGQSDLAYEGYKPKQTWLLENGIRDQIEHYNINKDWNKRGHPKALRPYLPLIDKFIEHNYVNILHPILRSLAVGMELPEDTFVKQHDMNIHGHTSARFMKYYPRSDEEEAKTRNVWLKGHTDFGSVTVLWSQPVGGLQILSPDGKWRWVRHIDNAVVINSGDALQFLCGGYYPPTRHRVIQPPADQNNMPRLGVFFFSMPNDNVKLVSHESPVLRREAINNPYTSKKVADALTMEEWRKARTKTYGKIELKIGKEAGVEEEIVGGIVVKHYN